FLALEHREDARRALQEGARGARAIGVRGRRLRCRRLAAVDLAWRRTAVHQLGADGRGCALPRWTSVARRRAVALAWGRAIAAAIAAGGRAVTAPATDDGSGRTTAATALLPAAAHDHDDQERDHHERQGRAQDQEQRERLSRALELNDGRRGHTARAVRLVVVHDQAHHRLLAGAGQDLVFIRRLELSKGLTRFERGALHAHRDQLLLRALGLIDVGAGERSRQGLSGGQKVHLCAALFTAPAEVAVHLERTARVNATLRFGHVLRVLDVHIQRPGRRIDADWHVLERVVAQNRRLHVVEHQLEALRHGGRHAGRLPLDDVHLREALTHGADDAVRARAAAFTHHTEETTDVGVGHVLHELERVLPELVDHARRVPNADHRHRRLGQRRVVFRKAAAAQVLLQLEGAWTGRRRIGAAEAVGEH